MIPPVRELYRETADRVLVVVAAAVLAVLLVVWALGVATGCTDRGVVREECPADAGCARDR